MKKIIIMLISFFIFSTSFAEMIKVADIDIRNFSYKNSNNDIVFSFSLENNDTKTEDNLRYGFVFKDKDKNIIEKIVVDDIFSLKWKEKITKNYKYENSKSGIAIVDLFITNNLGSPLAVSEISYKSDDVKKINVEKNTVLKECIFDKEEKSFVCETDKDSEYFSKNEVKVEVYERSIFGNKIQDINLVLDKILENKAYFKVKEFEPGYYEVKVISGQENDVFKFNIEGSFGKIKSLNIEKYISKKGESSKLNFSTYSASLELRTVYGVFDKNKKTCYVNDSKIAMGESELPVILEKKCNGLTPFAFLLDKNSNKILDTYNTFDKDISDFVVEKSIVEQNLNYLIAVFLVLFIIAIILWFVKRRTISIIIGVILILAAASLVFYQKVLAKSLQDSENTTYTINKKDFYLEGEPISFTLGISNELTYKKEKNTSIHLSIFDSVNNTNGGFTEIISESDKDSTYKHTLGYLKPGVHWIIIRSDLKALFDISRFDLSKFGTSSDGFKFEILVAKNGCLGSNIDACIPPSTVLEPNIDNLNLSSSCTNPAEISPKENQICYGHKFFQERCGNKVVKTGTSNNNNNCINGWKTENLECSINKTNWGKCVGEKITMPSKASFLYIRIKDDETPGSWTFSNKEDGEMEIENLNKEKEEEYVKLKFDFPDSEAPGEYGLGKFYTFSLKASIMPEFEEIKLKFLDPKVKEI